MNRAEHRAEHLRNSSGRGCGAVALWSQTLIPTAREAPTDAETPSHVLLHRAGFIRPVGAGVYNYLPLAWRTLQKIATIVREEMDAAGGSEMLMPALAPLEFLAETGRDVDYGDNLFRLEDRRGRALALAPTHEETITDLLRGCLTSYRQFPLILYQVQTKFRDEARPRAGLLRCREFIMKDAYSFHSSVEGRGGLNEAYDAMYRAYVNIFTRCGLSFTAVEAESGPIGGSASHEFMVNSDSGEDTVLVCDASGYAANVEKCEIGERAWSFAGEPLAVLETVHTPECPGIEEVARFLKAKPRDMLKTLVFEPAEAGTGGPAWVVAVVRGDHEANEGKVRDAVGFKVRMADEKAAREAGFAIGYVGPHAAVSRTDTLLLVDPDAAQGTDAAKGKSRFWAAGANEPDHHVKFFNWRRELGAVLDDGARVRVADIRNAEAGDPSPRAERSVLREQRGIEVGHIFKLGTKYSDAMGLRVLDETQQRCAVIMGCYGIGVSRTMAACVEMSHDGDGIVWPAAIAPYHVLITVLRPEEPAHADAAHRLATQLSDAGLDVLIDDRSERPGVKFKDADLIGLPVRLTVAEKALAEGAVEFKHRREPGKGDLVAMDEVVRRCREAVDEVR